MSEHLVSLIETNSSSRIETRLFLRELEAILTMCSNVVVTIIECKAVEVIGDTSAKIDGHLDLLDYTRDWARCWRPNLVECNITSFVDNIIEQVLVLWLSRNQKIAEQSINCGGIDACHRNERSNKHGAFGLKTIVGKGASRKVNRQERREAGIRHLHVRVVC